MKSSDLRAAEHRARSACPFGTGTTEATAYMAAVSMTLAILAEFGVAESAQRMTWYENEDREYKKMSGGGNG